MDELEAEKRRFMLSAKGGTPATIVGAAYWAVLAVAGFYLSPRVWAITAFFASGLIFPLSLAAGKAMKADFLKSPLGGATGAGFLAMMLVWPITIAAFYADVALVPLSLAIGMSLHLPIIGWAYGTRVFVAHVIVRAVLVSVVWFALPSGRFTVIPIVVSTIYLITTVVLWARIARESNALQPAFVGEGE